MVTVVDEPFLTSVKVENKSSCNDTEEVYCFKKNLTTQISEYHCCSGLVIDLLKRLAKNNHTHFTFELHLSYDGMYGKKVSPGRDGNVRILKFY